MHLCGRTQPAHAAHARRETGHADIGGARGVHDALLLLLLLLEEHVALLGAELLGELLLVVAEVGGLEVGGWVGHLRALIVTLGVAVVVRRVVAVAVRLRV